MRDVHNTQAALSGAGDDDGVRSGEHPPLLEFRDLKITFETRRGDVNAVNGVDLKVEEGEILCVVGESGCGKSVTTQSIVDLVPTPPGVIEGDIFFRGENLREMSKKEIRGIRGKEIGVIFQDPMSSLNPVHTVGRQVSEAIKAHNDWNSSRVQERAVELMESVGIPDAEERFGDYPAEFSGGMRQRVMIAIALANEPDLLIADEPTTALDVTIEAQVLELIRNLKDELGMSVIWITHDLGVVAEIASRVAVMYAGEIVEQGTVFDLFYDPKHPYTRGLLASIPGATGNGSRLEPIEGEPPDMKALPNGCKFHPRCPEAMPHCEEREPPTYAVGEEDEATQTTRCFLYEDHPIVDSDREMSTNERASVDRDGDPTNESADAGDTE